VTLIGYFLLGRRWQNLWLLGASLLFYAWGEPVYLLCMLASILLNYVAGRALGWSRQATADAVAADRQLPWLGERSILIGCISLNLLLLGYFKYFNFLVENLNRIIQTLAQPLVQHPGVLQPIANTLIATPIANPPIALPIGISFFTFQAMSYVIDVYRREVQVERSWVNCALYVSLFPQLIAGPIVRYQDVATEIRQRSHSSTQFAAGIRRFVLGLAKKVLLANPLGEIADQVFGLPTSQLSTSTAWLGIAAYTLQIYFDFSGYSDMAIGLGRMFGFEFLENFNFPYISQSVQEFWRRWHISLSTWFRDYLYIPLGGNRLSPTRTYLNLWVVFILCGLWHGASWNFLIWGILHGACLALERLGLQRLLQSLWQPLRHSYTLLVVMVGWVFFRTESLEQAMQYLSILFHLGGQVGNLTTDYRIITLLDSPKTWIVFGLACLFATPLFPIAVEQVLIGSQRWLRPQGAARWKLLLWKPWLAVVEFSRYGYLVLLFSLSAAYLAAGTYNPFIYYRF
jgi:alginate O-acetyltransferase complex protein AlgI